ncbi:MAG: DUF1653 domain-containing protein [bacterium]|nr:DUF1653 domain-containing protein [bacterium]
MPPTGFYYHYKHDPNGPFNDYSYEVIGTARHTEEKTFTVLYRPLYENDWFKPATYQARPLEMFNESVTKDGKAIPRFQQITDPELIAKLEKMRDQIYGK